MTDSMKGGFTPGPWRVAGKATGIIAAPDGNSLVHVAVVGAYRDKELLPFNKKRWNADAHLISAAPELYQALHDLCSGGYDETENWKRADTALKKARGEP